MSPPPCKKARGPYYNANCSVTKLLRYMADPDEMQRKRERAYAEEAEKKRHKMEEKRKAQEEHWIALGVAVCCLSLDDFIAPPPDAPSSSSSPEALLKTLSELQNTQFTPEELAVRGKVVLSGAFTFASNLKALLGHTAKSCVFSDIHQFSSLLTCISKSNVLRIKKIEFK